MPGATSDRVAQLHRGVQGAAASLPPEHAALAERAAAAADRLRARVRALEEEGAEADESTLEEVVERLEALHYAVLRVTVLDEDPEAAEALEETDQAARLAERLEGL